ncbi:MAG: M42 family metallopeptidase [Nitrososphaerales archaeon]
MIRLMTPYVDEVVVDKLENVIGIKRGKEKSTKIMLAAHMDEVGLMVKTISKDGFLQFSKMGGIDDRILPAQMVTVFSRKNAFPGIVGSKPPHIQKEEERKKIIASDELFIDVGAESREDALAMGIAVGDPVGFNIKYTSLGREVAVGKAFDNRAGCATMIETLKLLAFHVDPDVAIALDVTIAGDVPGVREYDASVKMGEGPAVTISDSGLITHPKVLRWLLDSAEEEKIPFQIETGLMGSTDAARISLTRQGIPSGNISIPTRYIHSPVGMLSLKDIENSAKLTVAAIQRTSRYF